MPSTSSASSSWRILRAPISAVIVEPSVPATIAVVSTGPSSRRKAIGAIAEIRSIAPNAEASEPPWIPIVEKPITKATIVAGPSVTRSEKMNWRTNSWRHESPGLISSAPTLSPRPSIPPAFRSQSFGGTSERFSVARSAGEAARLARRARAAAADPADPAQPWTGLGGRLLARGRWRLHSLLTASGDALPVVTCPLSPEPHASRTGDARHCARSMRHFARRRRTATLTRKLRLRRKLRASPPAGSTLR